MENISNINKRRAKLDFLHNSTNCSSYIKVFLLATGNLQFPWYIFPSYIVNPTFSFVCVFSNDMLSVGRYGEIWNNKCADLCVSEIFSHFKKNIVFYPSPGIMFNFPQFLINNISKCSLCRWNFLEFTGIFFLLSFRMS